MVKFKKSLCMFIVVLLMFSITGTITALAATGNIPDPTSQFYVNDFANVIDDDVEAQMQEKAVALAEATDGIQVVVTTVKTIGDENPVYYTTDMYNKYKIGKNNMGVLIMLSVETRDIQIRLGDNMTKYITDGQAGRIIDDYGLEYLGENDFEKGLSEIQSAVINHISSKQVSAESEVAVNSDKTVDTIKLKSTLKTIATIIIMLAIGISAFIGIGKYLMKKEEEKKRVAKLEKDYEECKTEFEKTLKSVRETFTREIKDKDSQISRLNNQLSHSQSELEEMKERRKRALMAYPDVEQKIDKILKDEKIKADKAKAHKVTNILENALRLTPSKDNLSALNTARSTYNSLTRDQQQYVDSSLVEKLNKAINEAEADKAEFERQEKIRRDKQVAARANNLILAALACSVTRNHLNQFSDACNAYERLSSDQKSYISADVKRVYDMKRKSQRLQEEYEEEERRRREEEARRRRQAEEQRRRMMSSTHSSRPSSGGFHSGMGGRSSGHGGGRKF